jgi:RNA polymerase-binding transcription factor DksA
MNLDLPGLRAQLEGRLRELGDREARISDHLHNRDREVPEDWPDRAAEAQGDEVLEALDHGARDELRQLRAALLRIDAGTFGACARCGEPISAKRLMALPTTPLCLACASAA